MKSLRTTTLAAAMVLLVAASASAAPTLGVYFDAAGTTSDHTVTDSNPFDIYVVMSSINNQASGVEYKLTLPPELVVLDGFNYGGENPIYFGSEENGYAVGFGECIPIFDGVQGQETFVAQTLTVMRFSSFDQSDITLSKFQGSPDSFTVNAPRYDTCDHTLYEMEVENATIAAPVSTGTSSWSSMKALFD